MKRLICLLLVLTLPAFALAEGTQKVFYEDETEPFPENAELRFMWSTRMGTRSKGCPERKRKRLIRFTRRMTNSSNMISSGLSEA